MRQAVKPNSGLKLPDITKPIKELEDKPTVECFGLDWDPTTRECSVCAANEICAVVTAKSTASIVKEKEKGVGFYMDQQDFQFDQEHLLSEIINKSGKMTSAELVALVKSEAKSRDDVAVIEWIKRFITSSSNLSIRDKIVYYE